MKIAVVDDEKLWQDKIRSILKEQFQNEKETYLRIFDSAQELFDQKNEYDIVFMDVELGEQDGLELGKKYKALFPESILIIVTTHKEWCNRGYQAEAFRYLDKSNLEEELNEAIESAHEKLIQQKVFRFHVITLGEVELRVKDILYFETSATKRNIILHTIDKTYYSVGTMAEYEKQMQEFGFYLIHRSYLVNFAWVEDFTRTSVQLKNGESIDLSVRKYGLFKKSYFEWKIKRGNG